MEKSGLFPPMVISLTKIGEDTGSLDAMLDKVAEFYGNEVDDMVARMQTILDPILIVILGIVIGTWPWACSCPCSRLLQGVLGLSVNS
jgi:type IV pilus assembly protein PilC